MGASILEDVMNKELFFRLGLQFKKQRDRRFTQYIAEAKEEYSSK
jgi:hypothetical protein